MDKSPCAWVLVGCCVESDFGVTLWSNTSVYAFDLDLDQAAQNNQYHLFGFPHPADLEIVVEPGREPCSQKQNIQAFLDTV